ncbi:uncharacterized protein PFL1_01545 [Pseudozyma flocculosa PF-1]|uniref:E2 ubiquitin-conjugating enzyme n=1 Tax=Pseudozyma flocculosa TaxID=84751 RepID=A0A5C3EZ21_9BASI|nr:uncharacterized protein PFL1_01545 [Pseudozyma flocculosa PF-1]EPQ30644.1 hypothetical protein PFL1_01545 [Pseudozyma flocculosa PF-1]SPO37025.1 related to E2 ubiquitin-conjugating enzyme [Pseudozyma flocculosa]
MVAPQTLRRLSKELLALSTAPPDGVRVVLDESDILSFRAWIQGPPGTPYDAGTFEITFDFQGVDFPNVPPVCKFATKIFHPNVSRSGDICVSTLKKDWKPDYGIGRILVTIKCLLIAPNPDSALDPEASRLLQEDYAQYAETARLWTEIYAAKPPPAAAGPFLPSQPSSSSSSSSAMTTRVEQNSTSKAPALAPAPASTPSDALALNLVAANAVNTAAAAATAVVVSATALAKQGITTTTTTTATSATQPASTAPPPPKKVMAGGGPKRGLRRL